MFDIGWSEMLVVGAVALVVIGPKDLPAALRQAGKWMGAVRRMAADFQGHVNEAMREAELDELRREVNNLKTGVGAMADPVRTAGNEMKALVEAKPALPAPEPAPAIEAPKPGPKSVPKPRSKPKPAPATKPKPKPKSAPRKKPEPKS
jgi:sec-independent protein translocase protein TatB